MFIFVWVWLLKENVLLLLLCARVSDYGVRWKINVSKPMWKWSKSKRA